MFRLRRGPSAISLFNGGRSRATGSNIRQNRARTSSLRFIPPRAPPSSSPRAHDPSYGPSPPTSRGGRRWRRCPRDLERRAQPVVARRHALAFCRFSSSRHRSVVQSLQFAVEVRLPDAAHLGERAASTSHRRPPSPVRAPSPSRPSPNPSRFFPEPIITAFPPARRWRRVDRLRRRRPLGHPARRVAPRQRRRRQRLLGDGCGAAARVDVGASSARCRRS